jgi:hypothetical protein
MLFVFILFDDILNLAAVLIFILLCAESYTASIFYADLFLFDFVFILPDN